MRGSVSSNLRMNLPSYIFTYSLFTTMPLADPSVGGPLGFGANLITTLPFSAFSSGGSFVSLPFSSFGFNSAEYFSISFFFSASLRDSNSLMHSLTTSRTSLAFFRSSGFSAIILPITAFSLGFPYLKAFWTTYFNTISFTYAGVTVGYTTLSVKLRY